MQPVIHRDPKVGTMPVILSLEGSREVREEMRRPPEDTPERRKVFEGVRRLREAAARRAQQEAQAGKT